MISMPGATPEKFYFTVRDDAVAQRANQVMERHALPPLRGESWPPDLLLRRDRVLRHPGDGRRRDAARARRHRASSDAETG